MVIREISLMGRKVLIRPVSQRELLEKRSNGDLDGDPTDEVHGYYSQMEQTIYIHSGLDTDAFRRTLIHELAHATLAFSGLTHLLEDKTEEALCDLFENWLTLFQDKKFIEYLRD